MSTPKACKGCGSTTRKLDNPGPRCGECHRAILRERREAKHAAHLGEAYGLTAVEYAAIKAYQDGYCWGCLRATGASRALSVDHRHSDGLIRGLLCRTCNTLLGHLRDDPAALRRFARYLEFPPAVEVLGERFVPLDGAPTHREGSIPSARTPSRRSRRRKTA